MKKVRAAVRFLIAHHAVEYVVAHRKQLASAVAFGAALLEAIQKAN